MIVVDTSVWVAARRQSAGEISKTPPGLLDADEVASLADETGALVWSLDRDFAGMARLKLAHLFE